MPCRWARLFALLALALSMPPAVLRICCCSISSGGPSKCLAAAFATGRVGAESEVVGKVNAGANTVGLKAGCSEMDSLQTMPVLEAGPNVGTMVGETIGGPNGGPPVLGGVEFVVAGPSASGS